MTKSPKRMLAGLAAVAATALALAGCSSGAQGGGGDDGGTEPTHSITIAVAPDFMFTEYYVADALDTFEEFGVEVTLVEYPSAYESLEAVVSGQADVTSASATLLASLAGKGAEIRAIAQNTLLSDWISLVAGDGVTVDEPEDMIGLKVGATFNGIMDYTARQFFTAHDLTADQMTYEDVKYAQLLPALQSGSSDVVTLGEPNTTKALASIPGASEVLDSRDYGSLFAFLIVGTKINDDAELKTKVLDAMEATYAAIDEDPSVAVQHAMRNSGLTDEAQATSIQEKVTYGLNFDQEPLDWAAEVAEYYREMGLITASDEEVFELYDVDGFKEWEASR